MRTNAFTFIFAVIRGYFEPRERPRPSMPLPTVKTDLATLPRERDTIIWLGHSSFFVQLGGKRLLIDPVFSSYAAPFPWTEQAPHCARPQPYLVPVRPSSSRITHRRGVSASAWTS